MMLAMVVGGGCDHGEREQEEKEEEDLIHEVEVPTAASVKGKCTRQIKSKSSKPFSPLTNCTLKCLTCISDSVHLSCLYTFASHIIQLMAQVECVDIHRSQLLVLVPTVVRGFTCRSSKPHIIQAELAETSGARDTTVDLRSRLPESNSPSPLQRDQVLTCKDSTPDPSLRSAPCP